MFTSPSPSIDSTSLSPDSSVRLARRTELSGLDPPLLRRASPGRVPLPSHTTQALRRRRCEVLNPLSLPRAPIPPRPFVDSGRGVQPIFTVITVTIATTAVTVHARARLSDDDGSTRKIEPQPIRNKPKNRLRNHVQCNNGSQPDPSASQDAIQSKASRGQRPFHPSMMDALPMWAYSAGVYSSLRINRTAGALRPQPPAPTASDRLRLVASFRYRPAPDCSQIEGMKKAGPTWQKVLPSRELRTNGLFDRA